jgi:hypothetical protein
VAGIRVSETSYIWHDNRIIISQMMELLFEQFLFLQSKSVFFPLYVVLLICWNFSQNTHKCWNLQKKTKVCKVFTDNIIKPE